MNESNFPSVEEFYSTRMLTNEQMVNDKDLAEKYFSILKQAADKNSPLYVNGDFVSHGVTMCCANPIGGILITGINPSFNPHSPNGCYYTLKEAILNKKSYWSNKKKQIIGDNDALSLIEKTAYLDLFPYSESSQKKFQDEIDMNINNFQVRVLETTLSEIERLRPRLIIAANKQTSYYWGIKKDSTWLGYNLQIVEKSQMPECLNGQEVKLYRIVGETGFKKADDRIGQNKYLTTNLLGAYFIDYALYDNRHQQKFPKRILTPSIVNELYRIAKNSPDFR